MFLNTVLIFNYNKINCIIYLSSYVKKFYNIKRFNKFLKFKKKRLTFFKFQSKH
jgi:hypothetical protein